MVAMKAVMMDFLVYSRAECLAGMKVASKVASKAALWAVRKGEKMVGKTVVVRADTKA